MSKEDDTGRAGFGRIVRGLSDLFDFLSELDDSRLPRRGKREKNGMVIEYSFGKQTITDRAQEGDGPEGPAAEGPAAEGPAAEGNSRRQPAAARRRPRPGSVEVLEPVTDMFDELNEVLLLFEVPGVARKDIRCVLDGDILLLEAKTGERLYRKEVLIEPKLAGSAPRMRLRNGVLEVRLATLKPSRQQPG